MSRSTVVVGINQTIMAALSMVTVAALIDAPGLGQTVLKALQTLDVGVAFNAGLAIVVLAIVLDRVTTAAGDRPWRTASLRRKVAARRGRGRRTGGDLVLADLRVGGRVPDRCEHRFADRGRGADVTTWVQDVFGGFTYGVRDAVTKGVLNPLEALLTESPWWLVGRGRRRAGRDARSLARPPYRLRSASACWSRPGCGTTAWSRSPRRCSPPSWWSPSGIVLGVWTGRNQRVDSWLRPILDAGQTMPPFVYLVPFLALFGTSRFTAIAAAVVFAVPVTTKIVADGIRAVPVATVEAANSVGSSTWQVISKVQLPVARRAITLAVNQGLIYVLSMVVVGGLVGAGALGYDVAAGFAQSELYGKGLAAGLAIVLLGVMLDRITQAAARRTRKFKGTVRGDNLW